ncbi:MAG: LamG-like jellyroll fold domain-containing protein, partial [Planctomycetota bacterium]
SLAEGPTDWLPRSMRLLVSDYIDTGYTSSLGDFTAAIWFRDFENSPRAYERIIDKDFTAGFWLGRNNSAAEFGGGIREGSSPFGHFTPVVVGQWHHIALQREGTTKRLWLDGVVAYEGFIPSTATNTGLLRVGLNSGGNSELDFAGLVLSLSGAADAVPALYAGPSQSSAKKRKLLQLIG